MNDHVARMKNRLALRHCRFTFATRNRGSTSLVIVKRRLRFVRISSHSSQTFCANGLRDVLHFYHINVATMERWPMAAHASSITQHETLMKRVRVIVIVGTVCSTVLP